MYVYIIDTAVIKQKTNIVSQIRSLSKQYNIEGSFVYISILHDLKKEVLANIKDRTNTIIVVGNYGSLNRVMDVVFQLDRVDDVVFGLIPIELDSMSKIFGMTGSVDRDMFCISQRLNKRVDVCVVNNKYFFDSINFVFSYGFNIEIDASYIINFKNNCEIVVGSMFFDNNINGLSNSSDGFFDILLYSKLKNKREVAGRFKAKKLNINSKFNIKYVVNGIFYKANNIQVDIFKEKVKIILSKNSVLNNL